MEIVLNLAPLLNFFSLPADEMFRRIILYYGWMIPAVIFLYGAGCVWLAWRRRLFFSKQKFVLLAIDVPRANEQTPKALENMLCYLAGAHGTINLIETYWEGKFQLGFSFEIVGIDGYIQFLVRTPVAFRSLVETAIYSQYPDAEIAEVDDYVNTVPSTFPDPDFDMWGAEFIPVQMEPEFKQALPIKTYKDFEYQLGRPEFHFKDPMAPLMDLMSSLRPGEQIWYQLLILPVAADWSKIGKPAIDNVLGIKPKDDPTIVDRFFEWFLELMSQFSEMIYSLWGNIEDKPAKEEKKEINMLNLLPVQKKQIEAIQEKISKMGYGVKLRMIYVSRREVMNKPKAVNGFVGFIKQFNANDLNALKPDTKVTQTSSNYFYKLSQIIRKKNKVIRAYKDRDDTAGRKLWYLNVEEIASLWHFPIETVVKAPLIQKTTSKKMEPPMALPVEDSLASDLALDDLFNLDDESVDEQPAEAPASSESSAPSVATESHQAPPPSNLPGIND
ncbi:MAG TPA: hypothetical protein PLA53_00665 [bacterium]|jgi:hypothetical protein|nr:hypothetical protein [bacterium]HNZ51473.1 hypothetical protein [bacterium]HOF79447.1 hypothetical protein [bacterium]HOH85282.1 hypothetical protein [bacterium]HOQ91907.1 hypothetical protein [bacterium]